MGLISNFFKTVREALSRPPYASPCKGNCVQGRECTCAPDYETYINHQRDDEFNNANWPFPVGKKP